MQNIQLTYMEAADQFLRGAEALGGGAESNIFVVAQRERWPESSMGFVNEQNQAAIQMSQNFNRIYSKILGKDFDAATASVEDVKTLRDNVLIDGKPIDYEPGEINRHSVLGMISMAVAKELAGVQNMKTNGALDRNAPAKPVSFTLADSKEPLFVDMRSYLRDTSIKPRKPSKPNIFKRLIHSISDKAFKNEFDRYDRLKKDYDAQMEEYNKGYIYDRMDAAMEERQKRVEVENKAWSEAQKVNSLEQTDNMLGQVMDKAKAAGLDTRMVSEALDNARADMTIIDFMELQEEAGMSGPNKTTQAVTNERENEMSMGGKTN